MAHTTTATAIYSLFKYSRSYPITRSQSTSNNEWQHFTNPTIRLILDATKNGNAELLSVRLRVVWTIQNGAAIATVNNSAEIILEDLDLLIFSTLPLHQGAPMNIPLKAVYRDTTIGMRYLHPLDEANSTVFRRFQVSFATEHDANAFISSIRTVCPCRMSPDQPNRLRQKDGIANPGLGNFPAQYLQHGGHWQTREESQTMLGSAPSDSRPPQAAALTDSHKNPTYASNVPQASGWLPMPPSSAPSQFSSRTFTPQIQGSEVSVHDTHIASVQQSVQQTNNSSQPCIPPGSSQVVATMPNNANQPTAVESPTSSQAGHMEPSHPIFSALKEATSIYDLPPEHLELIVGDVIREDGFIPLLKRLNQLWRIKSLVKVAHDIGPFEHTK